MADRLGVVVLISGSGSNLQALIDAAGDRMPIEIAAVVSNRPGVMGLERARRAGIPAHVVDDREFPDRAAFETVLRERIDRYRPGLVCLAGFMRILTPETVLHYAGRMLNIHPSLLPAFPGLHTHRRAIEAGCREHGASVHFVTPDLDGGPVVARIRVPVLPGDDPETLARRVLEQEHRLYPAVVDWFARGRLDCRDGAVVLDGRPLEAPVDLTGIGD